MKAVTEQQATMDNVISSFFESLTGPHVELPKTISGALRFDLENGRSEHWRVTFDKGMVSTSSSDAAADCIAHSSKETMAAIIQGTDNAMAALLRGTITVEGKTLLLALFRNLLTKPTAGPKVTQRVGKNTGRRE
jgi:putative sterol carrier protein